LNLLKSTHHDVPPWYNWNIVESGVKHHKPNWPWYILNLDEIACADPQKCEAFCNNKAECSNFAYPLLVLRLLPKGKSAGAIHLIAMVKHEGN